MKRLPFSLLVLGLAVQTAVAQQITDFCHELRISVQNVKINSDMVEFDLFLKSGKSKGDPCGVVHLGHSDFVIEFNESAFRDPGFVKVGETSTGGSCGLIPQEGSGYNTMLTRINYFAGISTRIMESDLVINLAAPSPSSEEVFASGIAAIDNRPQTHKLATFRVTGYAGGNPGFNMVRMVENKRSIKEGDGPVVKSPTVAHAYEGTGNFRSYPVSMVPDGPFSLEVKNFSAVKKNKTSSQLFWMASWEKNTQSYVVQRSEDGRSGWREIGVADAKGLGNVVADYKFPDDDVYKMAKPMQEFYYRLKIVDRADNFTFSNVQKVQFASQQSGLFEAQLYPNPSVEGLHVKMLPTDGSNPEQIVIYDVSGKLAFSQDIEEGSEYTYLDYQKINIESGMYFIQFRDNDEVFWHEKIEVQK